jgi:hypothetical protein
MSGPYPYLFPDMDQPPDLVNEASRVAFDNLERQLEQAARAAWAEKKDFVRARHAEVSPDFFEPFDITRPIMMSYSYRAGAAPAGVFSTGPDWIVWSYADAVRLGLVE